MKILFCRNLLEPSRPDRAFEAEVAAVERLSRLDVLVDHDALVERLLDDPRADIPAALVLDAGVIRDVGPAVVEANAASGAEIYGCDPRDVLDVLRAATVINCRS
jgi:ATP-grasp domain, R2K clade family 2